MNGGGSPKVVHTLGGGLAKGVLGVYKGGGWVKKGQKSAYVICTQPPTWRTFWAENVAQKRCLRHEAILMQLLNGVLKKWRK